MKLRLQRFIAVLVACSLLSSCATQRGVSTGNKDTEDATFAHVTANGATIRNAKQKGNSIRLVTDEQSTQGGKIELKAAGVNGYTTLWTGREGPNLMLGHGGSGDASVWVRVDDGNPRNPHVILRVNSSDRVHLRAVDEGGIAELNDRKSRPRLRLKVRDSGASIEFLNADGKIVKTITETSP